MGVIVLYSKSCFLLRLKSKQLVPVGTNYLSHFLYILFLIEIREINNSILHVDLVLL